MPTLHYLGLPKFLINNGDPKWWESPDIYLTHPGDGYFSQDDFYHPVENNRINIKVTNTGTHPVRSFWLGVNHFGNGFLADAFRYCENLDKDSGTAELLLNNIIKAGDEYIHEYDKTFNAGQTHDYIVAKASLLSIVPTTLENSATFNPKVEDADARRNLDLYDSTPVVNKEVSPYKEEKFALLFSGSTDDQYKTDIENVFITLVDYYGFMPGQIWIVLGQTGNEPVCTGANFVTITDKGELETAFNSFSGTVSTLRAELGGTDYINSAVVYVTGEGNANNLEIVGDGSVTILEDEAWFSGKCYCFR